MADIEIESQERKSKIPSRNHGACARCAATSLASLIDSGAFGAALGFIGYSTVLPTMALALSKSEPFVGLITTIWSGMWLLPQTAGGRWMAGRAVQEAGAGASAAFVSRIGLLIFWRSRWSLNLESDGAGDAAADCDRRSFAAWMAWRRWRGSM